MKKIPLTRGKYALVDNEDFEYLNQWKWHTTKLGYAIRTDSKGIVGGKPKNSVVYMHRVIMDTPKGFVTDHINSNKLDNRKKNLQVCKQGMNVAKKSNQSNNTSGYRGVTFNKRKGKWMARFTLGNKTWFLGYHLNPEYAAKLYDKTASRELGRFAVLNFKETK